MSEKKLTEMTTKELKKYIDQLYNKPADSVLYTSQLTIHLLMLLIRTVEETS